MLRRAYIKELEKSRSCELALGPPEGLRPACCLPHQREPIYLHINVSPPHSGRVLGFWASVNSSRATIKEIMLTCLLD